MHRITLRLEKGEDHKYLLNSLKPETEDSLKKVHVELLSELPGICIEADDSHALRAALNSYMRWLDIAERIGKKFT